MFQGIVYIGGEVMHQIDLEMKFKKKIIGRFLILLGPYIPDKLYIRFKYRYEMGTWPNIDCPKTFNEKLNWLKLYNRKPEYTQMVDKYMAKEYVSSIVGNEIVIPTIGLWNSPQKIDWDKLPNRFVLKTTHGGGGTSVIICRDKSSFDKEAACEKLKLSMKADIYAAFREWPYKNVTRRIIAEENIDDGGDLYDYKFFCFNGKVRCYKVDFGRFTEHHANYYDINNNLLPFGEVNYPPVYSWKYIPPDNLGRMIQIAELLSKDIPFLRVDLYNIKGKIYFGEMTFFPAAGMGKLSPSIWDRVLGDWLDLKIR